MTFVSHDGLEIDALRTDRYLEDLLSGTADPDPGPDMGLAATATRLRRDLTRVHPSFRFEERLARRLADIALAMRLPAAAGVEGLVPPIARFPLTPDLDPADLPEPLDDGTVAVPRPVLIGGAVASAALSIAGAALVAWRLRSSGQGGG